jgi:glycosyltransferase involved in cell wall biosynthesis
MSTPDVSVIVPVYNGAKTITALLESLAAQRFEINGFKIIVVDNGSTGATADRVAPFSVRLLHERNIQNSAARNRGVRAAQGATLAFIDADCIAHPDWLRALCPALAAPTHTSLDRAGHFSDYSGR